MTSLLLAMAVASSSWPSPELASAERERRREAEATVVARVNGEPVTRAELERMRGNPVTRRELLDDPSVDRDDPTALDRVAMRRLVHRRLLLQEARRRNITVSQDELDAAVGALRRRFDDLKSFSVWMREQGLGDESLFETVRGDLTADRVWASLVKDLRVTEQEVRRYHARHAQELVIGEEVRLRIIAVKERSAADEVVAALKKGASFGQLARERSLGKRARQGGDTGWVDARTLPPALSKAVPLLQPGDVGGPIENGAGQFLVVALKARRPLRATSLAEARPELERRVLLAKQQEVVHAWLVEQEAKSRIETFTEPLRGHARAHD